VPVVATAGHVDHGKSALILALTGMDPDRLREEKERGMTIDLGFAWLQLPSGIETGIVDVPGHERFIRNMLAGVGSVRISLFVVAANEGFRPQSVEHLAILDLLGVQNGVVAVTKTDLVDEETLELAIMEVKEHLAPTSLKGFPILPASSTTRKGLPELVSELDNVISQAPKPKDVNRPRLWADRVFTIKGAGTVVTGTLMDGKLRTEMEVELLPPGTGEGLKARIRGLQTHKHSAQEVLPGTRVAVNLSGVDSGQLERGALLCAAGGGRTSKVLHTKVRILESLEHEVRDRAALKLYLGAREVEARLDILEGKELGPGDERFCQFLLIEPIVCEAQDRFILRDATRRETIGGGVVLDAQPERTTKRKAGTLLKSLALSESSKAQPLLEALLAKQPIAPLVSLAETLRVPPKEAETALDALIQEGKAVRLVSIGLSSAKWKALMEESGKALTEHHKKFRLSLGMPREQLRTKLSLDKGVYDEVLAGMVKEGALVMEGSIIRLPSHTVTFSPVEEKALVHVLSLCEASPYAPPDVPTLLKESGFTKEVLQAVVEQWKLVKVSEDIVFKKEPYEMMRTRIVEHVEKEGKITVAIVRDLFGTSRKYALPLLEHFDAIGLTQRVGDDRVLRKKR
jgi:selenocysteine-specific elongation factor